MVQKIGLGGGCHWCTEAIFQSLRGVSNVQQGWIAALEAPTFSEAILLDFNPEQLPVNALLQIHLSTHSCTSSHGLRYKYRSAVYVFSAEQKAEAEKVIQALQEGYREKILTRVLLFREFKGNTENYLDYYRKDPAKPFCQNVITPKLRSLLRDHGKWVDTEKLSLPESGKE
ncbi:peptide-methionine (S)-S-oxide reductase [Muriicola jejuensis]|nr:peptide-methionine (S)-S-oxide reductase [Muriicola jejuensis]